MNLKVKALLIMTTMTIAWPTAMAVVEGGDWTALLQEAPFGVLLVAMAWMFLSYLHKRDIRNEGLMEQFHKDSMILQKSTNDIIQTGIASNVSLKNAVEGHTQTITRLIDMYRPNKS